MCVTRFLCRALLCLAVSTMFSTGAFAITIDEFDDDGVAESTVSGTPEFAQVTSSSAIGGGRALLASKTAGTLTIKVETKLGFLAHSLDALTSGYTSVHWDGDNEPSTIDYDGLGGIDFYQDPVDDTTPVDAIILEDVTYDKAFQATLIVYDASDPSGDTYSEQVISHPEPPGAIDTATITMKFDDFTTHGPGGAVDFSNVGAVFLKIEGSSTLDLSMEKVKTNGKCPQVPGVAEKIIDDCMVCGGNNENKDDCGVCFGNNQDKDDCGVCFGGNQDKDDCGVCFGGNQDKDDCGVCFGNNKDKDDCDVCFGGNQDKDDCGVCFGGNRDIDDCGVCFGNNDSKDVCGICGGDGTSCLDCRDQPFGNATVDVCGVCEGDGTSCLDCADIPFGTTQIDECGVCGGDGSTCGECVETNYSSLRLEVKQQTIRCARVNALAIRKIFKRKVALKKRLRLESKEVYKQQQQTIEQLPTVVLDCKDKPNCIQTNQTGETISQFANDLRAMYRELRKIVRELKNQREGGECEGSVAECLERVKGRTLEFRRISLEGRRCLLEAYEKAQEYPATSSVCE